MYRFAVLLTVVALCAAQKSMYTAPLAYQPASTVQVLPSLPLAVSPFGGKSVSTGLSPAILDYRPDSTMQILPPLPAVEAPQFATKSIYTGLSSSIEYRPPTYIQRPLIQSVVAKPYPVLSTANWGANYVNYPAPAVAVASPNWVGSNLVSGKSIY